MRKRGLAMGWLVSLVLSACGGETIYIEDDIDLSLDFHVPEPFVDKVERNLRTPYVRGARVTIRASSSDAERDWRSVTARIKGSGVFEIEQVETTEYGIDIRGTAVGEGEAKLVLEDGSEVLARATLEVLAPDTIELHAHGWLLIGRDEEAAVDEVRPMEGGTATYLVQYERAGRVLHGLGALSADGDGAMIVQLCHEYLSERREWLQVSADVAQESSLHLTVGEVSRSVPVVATPSSELARVEIYGMDEGAAEPGDWLVAYAQAYDYADRRLFGVEYRWTVDDLEESGLGDLYRYEYIPSQPKTLVAESGDVGAGVSIRAGDGYVDSTNDLGGCVSTEPGGLWPVALTTLLVGAMQRRRRRHLRQR